MSASNKNSPSCGSCCGSTTICSVICALVRWAVIALGVFVAAHTSKGISYDTDQTLWLVVLVLSLLNLFVKPLLVLFTLPFVLITCGVGLWLINAGLLVLTSHLVPGFVVDSFTAALWGALVISALSLLVNTLAHKSKSSCSKSDCSSSCCDKDGTCSRGGDCGGDCNCSEKNR